MRLFIAINFDKKLRSALTEAQTDMQLYGVRGNFTRPENLHITLAFIGDYPEPDYVLDIMQDIPFTPFPLTLEGLGAFHGLWWAGIRENKALSTYVKRLRRALAEAEIPFDRKKFSPHITLVRKPTGALPGIELATKTMTVDHVSLMRSDRGKNGMIYTEIGRV